MISRFVFDPHYIRRAARRIDLWGIGLLALGFGALQIVLDTGQRKDWFSSNYICVFAVLCVVGLVSLIVRELTTKHPIVDLRALTDRSFATGVFLITQLGFVLYASLVLLPIYLQTLLGYPAYNAGLALSPRGLGSLVTMPITGYLTSKTDPRRLLVAGVVSGSDHDVQLLAPEPERGILRHLLAHLFQGVALAFLFIPLMTLAMSGIPKEKMGNATSIFNLMRNIGGSFGIAIMTTSLARRAQYHQSHLAAHITAGASPRGTLAGLQCWFHAQGFDTVSSRRKALAALYGMEQQHAAMLSFVEAFWIMALLFLAMLPFLLLLRGPHAKPVVRAAIPGKAIDSAKPAFAADEQEQREEEPEVELLLH
jgi:MFS transporter, DHA2 family, multidrug resistance protein